MKLKALIMGGVLAAMLGLTVVGCNENPVDNPTGTTPTAPSNLQAVSTELAGNVGLMWTASSDTGTITYKVAWSGKVNADGGSVENLTTPSTTVTGLQSGQAYTFTVTAVRDGLASTGISLDWAPATRYTQDGSTTIRIYEFASQFGSGLAIDPAIGGPKNLSASSSNPNLDHVQLAMYTKNNVVSIGPAYAFTEYQNVEQFDHNVYISGSSYVSSSLNTWYNTQSVDTYIDAVSGNLIAFDIPTTVAGTDGQGFFVRTGTVGNYHYARVFMVNKSGSFLQGSGNDRYVELQISYQSTPNLPYAKGVVAKDSPVGMKAHRMSSVSTTTPN